jgi:hypothetical protein
MLEAEFRGVQDHNHVGRVGKPAICDSLCGQEIVLGQALARSVNPACSLGRVQFRTYWRLAVGDESPFHQ